MKYQIHITRQAAQDMDDAANYIRFTLLNPDAAFQLLLKAQEIIQSLDTYPQRNPIIGDPVLSSWGIRFVTVKHYLAFYVLSEEKQTVHIIRFLYGRQDWLHILGKGLSLE